MFSVARPWIFIPNLILALVIGASCDKPTPPASSLAAENDTLKKQNDALLDKVQTLTDELADTASQLAREQALRKELAFAVEEKAALTTAVSAEDLQSGYVLPFEDDKHLSIRSVGEAITKLEPIGISTRSGSHLRSTASAAKLSIPLTATGELSVAALIRPANLEMKGPARIVSISRDAQARNFTLGQEDSRLIVRFRTTTTGDNGTEPALTSPDETLTGKPQAVIFVRRGEKNLLFVDGKLAASVDVPGDLSNWDHSMPLILANELTGDRTWDGDIYKVAFFNKALTDEEAASTSADLLALLETTPKPPATTAPTTQP